jgi:hypothetical protein
VKAENYGQYFDLNGRSGQFAQFWQNVPCRASGQCLGSVIPLTYYSFFQEDLVIVSGQYLGSLAPFSGSFWAVFRQKKTDWTAQSVIVNR